MSEPRLDIASYLTAPTVDVAGGVTLGVALLSVVPKEAPAPIVRAAQRLRESTVALQKAWQAAHANGGCAADRRAADHRMIVAWNALWGRLSAYAELPADDYPRADRAAVLAGRMFSDGLSFLKLPYAREWAESDRRLALIGDETTQAELRALVGDDFVNEVKQAHNEYGAALGVTETQPTPPDVARVQKPLRDLQAAVRDYALQVVAAGNDGASFTDAARAALAPIDRMRAVTERGSSAGAVVAPRSAPESAPAPWPVPALSPLAASPLPQVTPTSPVPQVPET